MPYEILLPPFIPTPVHGWTGYHSPPEDPSLSLPPISFNTLTQAQTWDNFSYSIPSEGDSDNGRCSVCNLLSFVVFGNLNMWQMSYVAKGGQYSWEDICKTTYLKGCMLIYCRICSVKSKWVKCQCFQVQQNGFFHDVHSKNYFQYRFIYLLYFQGFIKVVFKQQIFLLLVFCLFFFLIDTDCWWKYPAPAIIDAGA